ncbi:MAG: LmeA family phospholipid-binding protein [Solirubrobacteraceae bacterium]
MQTRSSGRAARPVLIGAAGLLVAALVASQFLLPAVSERRLADELEQFGPRPDVQVSAFPAVKLLFGRADRIEIDATIARVETSSLVDELSDSGDVGELDTRIGELQIGLLRLSQVHLTKNADDVTATATITLSELQQALRLLANLRVVTNAGEGILLEGQVSVFGRTLGGQARVLADDGKLVVGLEGLPIGRLTLVDDERVRITGVGAREVPGGYRLSIEGVLSRTASGA